MRQHSSELNGSMSAWICICVCARRQVELGEWDWSKKSHIIQSCTYPRFGHKHEATKADNMGGGQANNE
jgi:hypothetical protein